MPLKYLFWYSLGAHKLNISVQSKKSRITVINIIYSLCVHSSFTWLTFMILFCHLIYYLYVFNLWQSLLFFVIFTVSLKICLNFKCCLIIYLPILILFLSLCTFLNNYDMARGILLMNLYLLNMCKHFLTGDFLFLVFIGCEKIIPAPLPV